MPKRINQDYDFQGNRIGGLPQAIAPGQALTYEQLGGGVATESATLTLLTQSQSHEQVFARPGTLATQSIRVWLAPTLPTDDNDLWQLEGVTLSAQCNVDQITVFFSSQFKEFGNIKINYQVQ
jgi:hypothetical protein